MFVFFMIFVGGMITGALITAILFSEVRPWPL